MPAQDVRRRDVFAGAALPRPTKPKQRCRAPRRQGSAIVLLGAETRPQVTAARRGLQNAPCLFWSRTAHRGRPATTR
eukprot:3898804-Alexandrium_andersonii.AAC.1